MTSVKPTSDLMAKWGQFLGTVPGRLGTVPGFVIAALALLTASGCGQSGKGEASQAARPIYAIVTSLPLFWGEGGFGDAVGGKDQRAPFIQQLSENADVRPIDAIASKALGGVTTLILAQPRLLAPEELVEIDRWVRAGGQVIAFADPLLDWPSDLPIGDARRAPPVTLLDPLFSHWGLALEGGTDGASVERMLGATAVTTTGAGRWAATGNNCTVAPDGFIAQCRIGKGRATFVADADVLDGRASLANMTAAVELIGG